jgi:hypothetical protein
LFKKKKKLKKYIGQIVTEHGLFKYQAVFLQETDGKIKSLTEETIGRCGQG